jgi:hypothetical protein
MQKIPDDATPQEVRKGVITEISDVEADPAVKALAPDYRTEVDSYVVFYRLLDPLEEEWIGANSALKVVDRSLDTVIKNFRLDLISLSNNKQTGPLFDRYLSGGLRAVTEAEMATAEPKAVQTLIDTLEADGGELAAKWVPLLKAALAPVVEKALVRHGVELRQSDLNGKIDKKIDALQEARVALHGQLRSHFKAAPERAEEYFYTWRRRRRTRSNT